MNPKAAYTKCDAWPLTRLSYARAKSPTPGLSTLITLAPRSASCLVQNGAAMACSRLTTVMPCKGRGFPAEEEELLLI